MRLARLVFSLYGYYVLAFIVDAFPTRMPIGAVFDHRSTHAYTAMKYEIEKYNNSSHSTFKLDKYERNISVSNSYALSKAVCNLMSTGVLALFGITNMTSIDVLESLSNRLHMPYVTPSIPKIHVGVKPGYTLHMRPQYDKAMIEIVKHYRWPKVYYVFDSDDGLMRLQQFYDVISRDNLSIEIDVRRLHDPTNSYELLRQLDARNPGEEKHILLDLSTEKITESLLRQVQNVGMNRVNYHYLLGGLGMDELDLDDFIHGGVNITGFRLLDPNRKRLQKVQREWSRLNPQYWIGAGTPKIKYDAALTMDAVSVVVKGLENMIKKDDKVFQEVFRRGKLYNNDSRGVECKTDPAIPWTKGTAIMNAFKNVSFEGVTGRVAFDKNGHRKNYNLEVMQMGLNRQTEKIGTWDFKNGLKLNGSVHRKHHGEKRLNDTKIITTILSEPYLMIAKQPEDGKPLVGNERYIGFCADLARKVAEIIGFDYVLQEVKDGKYGAADDGNGQWNGMVGELTRKEADLAIAPLTITSFRERVIDFSKPFMRAGISIMIKKPEKQKPGVFSFMDPLSYEIWMCIIFAYIGVSIVLFLVSRFSPYEWQIEDSVQGPTFTNDFTLFNSLWFSLGAFMQQGCDISPRSMSGRIVGSVWWFFTLIIISSYTANLAAFLTVERMRTPIESADDLSKQTEIQYGTLQSGSTKTFFETSKINVYERMWQFMSSAKPSVFVAKTHDGVERVRSSKGKYAFLLESTMNDYYNQRKPCNTMKVGDNLDSKGYGIATPLESTLRHKINLAVLQLREDGELQKLHKRWWYDKGECGHEGQGKDSSQSALTLSNVAGIFYILIGGLGLSMVVSLLEFLYKSSVESRRQKATFGSMRSSSRMSQRGSIDHGQRGMQYTYTAPTQIISLDGYADGNTHTQV